MAEEKSPKNYGCSWGGNEKIDVLCRWESFKREGKKTVGKVLIEMSRKLEGIWEKRNRFPIFQCFPILQTTCNSEK
jgi:hypothetical protein